jgi:hypothetical protein
VSGASSDHFRKCHTTNKKEQPHGVQRTNERKTAVLKHYRFSLRPTTRIHTLTRLPPPHYLFPLSVVSARSLLCRWSDLRRLALEGNLCESRSLVTSLRNTRCIPKRSGSLRVLSLNCVSVPLAACVDTHQAYTTRHTPASSRDTFLWRLGDTLCQRTDAETRNWCPQPGPLSRPAAQPSPTYQPLG